MRVAASARKNKQSTAAQRTDLRGKDHAETVITVDCDCRLPDVLRECARGEGAGLITSLIVRDSDGLVHVYLSTPPTSRPACAAATLYWMIPNENSETGKKLYSMLLAAQLAGRPVNIVGKNTCVRWGDGEDIQSVSIAP